MTEASTAEATKAEVRQDPAPRDTISLEPSSNGEDRSEGAKASEAMPPPSKWPFIVAGLLLVGLLAWSGYLHWEQRREALQTRDDTIGSIPEVQTVEAKLHDEPIDLTLPGQTEAFDTANIYPRATGYVAERKVDIGSRVRRGDLLIHIAAPDLDQQLEQARAQLGQVQAALTQAEAQVSQSEANLNLAQATFGRAAQLTQQGYETLQNRDNSQANLTSQKANVETARAGVSVAEANIKSQQATVDRLQALASFEDVVAPFDGVVTARNTDVGDLLNADASTGSPLFTIARDDVLRVSVLIPQDAAVGVRDGLSALVLVPQMPGRAFKAQVARSSVALAAASRSLMAEVDVPNPDGALRPGLYVTVHFAIPRQHPDVDIPSEALIFDQHGTRVAVVDQDSKVTMLPVTIDRDLGTSIEVKAGLSAHTRVVLNPPATLDPGQSVKATPRKDDDAPGGSSPDAPDGAKQAKTETKERQD